MTIRASTPTYGSARTGPTFSSRAARRGRIPTRSTLTRSRGTFLAIIGEKYDITGNVWAYSTASGGAWSTVDFSITLAGTITSSGGVLLAWDVAPSAVPVPPSLLLLAPGLAGLAVLRRRLKK